MTHENIGANSIPVIHCYGHTGSGITLFYGCARDAAQMAVDAIMTNRRKQQQQSKI